MTGGSGMKPRTLARIRAMIAGFPSGKRFFTGDISRELGISAREVGAVLKYQDDVKKIGRVGTAAKWEKI